MWSTGWIVGASNGEGVKHRGRTEEGREQQKMWNGKEKQRNGEGGDGVT